MNTKCSFPCWLALLALALLNAQPSTGFAQGTKVFPIATNNGDTSFAIASDGTNYLVGVQGDYISPNNYAITAQLFGPTGALIGSRINPVPGHTGGNPSIACSGTNYLMVWPDDYLNGNRSSVSGQLLSPTGGLVGGMIAITTNSAQEHPTVAYGAGKYLVTWNDVSDGAHWKVYGQLVSASGALIGGNFLICAPADAQNSTSAAAAFDGTNFLVAWVNVISLYTNNVTSGVFVSPSGAVGTPFDISQSVSLEQDPLCVVFNGSNYLVVWNFENPDLNIYDLYGRFVTPSGTFLGNEFAIEANADKSFPCVAFDGTNYLLTWNVNSGSTNANAQFQFLNAGGQPMGPQFTPFSAQGTEVPQLAVPLWDGKRFATVATLSSTGFTPTPTNHQGVYGAFITGSTAPPRLGVAAPFASSQFSLSLVGTPGINYAIQMATNLTTPSWLSLTTNSPTNGTFIFTDAGATNKSRFYRAVKR